MPRLLHHISARYRAGTEGFRVRLFGGRAPLRRSAPCVLRWKTLRVSSALHPWGLESLRLPTKKRSRFIRAWSAMFFGAGLRRLTANTSIYALPCGFAAVSDAPWLTRSA